MWHALTWYVKCAVRFLDVQVLFWNLLRVSLREPPHCGALRFWRGFDSLHTTSCVLSLLLREQVRNTLLVFSRMSGLRFRSRAAAGPRCKDLKRMPSNVNLGEFLSQYYKTELRQGKRRGGGRGGGGGGRQPSRVA